MGNIITTIKSLPGLRSLTPASSDAIAEAEIQLGLHFSDEYKRYLSEFGAIYSKIVELKGIAKTMGYDVVAFTKMIREVTPNIPNDFYVISDMETNVAVICQDDKGVIYEWRGNDEAIPIASSLVQYIENRR